MHHFRMELHAIQFLLFILHSSNGTFVRMGDDGKAFRGFFRIVLMAHPAYVVLFQTGEQTGLGIQDHSGLAVFTAAGMGYHAAQGLGHELIPVADAQYRDAQFEHTLIHAGSVLGIHAVGTAGQDDGFGILGFDLVQAVVVRNDFAINATFTHSSGNQLAVLCTEVDYQDDLML